MTKSYPQLFLEPPPGACQITLVRHGQSIPYVEGTRFNLVDGHGDPPLSPRGRWQAAQLAKRLKDEPISAIYSSPLSRTHETASPLAERLDLQIQVEPDLREVYLGEYEGGHFRQIFNEGGDLIDEMRLKREWSVIPGAESNKQLRDRTVAVIERLGNKHANELVAVVCHAGVIASLVGHTTKSHAFDYLGVRNSSITQIVITHEKWALRSFNDAAHAGGLTYDHDLELLS